MNHVPRRPTLIRLGKFHHFVRAAALVWSISAVALAQTHADTTIVAPELVSDDGVLYPPRAVAEGFLESVTVVLIVEIDALGRVTRAMVETPVGHGFEEASIEAGLRLRFRAAHRGGVPVPSRIRFRYTFEPPAPPLSKPAPAPPPLPPPAKPAAPVQDVRVRGQKATTPAGTSLSRDEVRRLPGAFGDPFRAIEVLPGVTPIASGLPFFYVRGAPPGNVGYYLDGVRVPALYHVLLGPSVIHPALVERVELHPGGYPARFGRFAGGIVTAEARAPQTRPHGEGNIRLFDAGAMVESGFGGQRGTVLLGGRYSYAGGLFSLISPAITLDYRDYQIRTTYDLTPRDRLTLFGFGSYDYLSEKENGVENVLFASEFYRLDLRYDRTYEGGALRTAVTLGYDRSHLGTQPRAEDFSIGIRTEFHQRLGGRVLLRGGADAVLDAYRVRQAKYVDPDDPETVSFNQRYPPRDDLVMGIWADAVVRVTPRVEITPGIRLDLYRAPNAVALGLDPRLAVRFRISDRLRLVHAYGVAHQRPSATLPLAGLARGDLAGGLQTSYQTSAGVEVDLGEDINVTATLFHNAFVNMTDTLGTSEDGTPEETNDVRARGSSVGFELLVRRRLAKRLSGFASYTLSRSERRIGREVFPSSFDRTHVANLALAYELGRGWRAGARLVFYTGAPKTNSEDGLISPLRTASPARQAPFHRLDVRLEKRWALGERSFLSFVAEIMNVTLREETFGDETIGPITIPSIGLEGGF